jgi:hypothetical protein
MYPSGKIQLHSPDPRIRTQGRGSRASKRGEGRGARARMRTGLNPIRQTLTAISTVGARARLPTRAQC